jgi:hypothetical protein
MADTVFSLSIYGAERRPVERDRTGADSRAGHATMPRMAAVPGVGARCAVHPMLPAYDACPVCERPRCEHDATLAPGGGCLACEGRRGRPKPPPADLRALAGAGVVCGLVIVPTGFVSSEYVGAGLVGYVVPLFVGIVVSMAAEAGAGKARGTPLRAVAAVYSVLAIAVGLRLPRAAGSPFSPVLRVLVLYVLAAVASWLWTLPPRPAKKKSA